MTTTPGERFTAEQREDLTATFRNLIAEWLTRAATDEALRAEVNKKGAARWLAEQLVERLDVEGYL